MDANNLLRLQKSLKVNFKNLNLLKQAMVHRSYLNEHPGFKVGHNERLEFLGDAVLEIIVTEYLFLNFNNLELIITSKMFFVFLVSKIL